MSPLRGILLAASLCAASPSFAEGIAFLSDVKGSVAIDGNPRAPILAELVRGQRITLARDAAACVMYIASGKEYALRGPAEFLVKETEITGSNGMPPVVRNSEWRTNPKVLSQVVQASSASVRMRSLALAKADTARLVFPTQGNVSTLQPTFRWRPAGEAQGDITVLVPGEERPVHRARATGDSYRLPAKLKPETEYVWTYTVAGEEVASARFRTLPETALRDIEQRRPSDKSRFSDRVLFTLMLHEMGAFQEAHESWKRLSQERADLPELSALAR
jgi:hypothetical protein